MKTTGTNRSALKWFGMVILIAGTLGSCKPGQEEALSPLEKILPVAQRVMDETSFSFEPALQSETHRIHRIEPGRLYGKPSSGSACALSFIHSPKDTSILFGISYSGACIIRINDEPVFEGKAKAGFTFGEYTYNRFHFDTTLAFHLSEGYNKLLSRIDAGPTDWILFLRPIDDLGDEEHFVDFSLSPFAPELEQEKWLVCGPFATPENEGLLPPEMRLEQVYTDGGSFLTWKVLPRNMLRELSIDPDNAYTRESYADWHYGIGAALMGFFRLTEVTRDERYVKFARQWCDFAVDNLDYFTFQHNGLHAIRGSYHRMIRKTMLDDCGSPALPLLELHLLDGNQKYLPVINTMAEYVRFGQSRLDDGTYCRPEPVVSSIWGDDLFMSGAFSLRMAKITDDPAWYDDVALQALQFKKYLLDEEAGLYKHGWFSPTNSQSEIFWCRANGWIIWATAEILAHLPADHPNYPAIQKQFNIHIENLVSLQDQGGLWHQVLDHPETYLETSGSAMYVLAIARGIREGWLPGSYKENAERGWRGISSRISEDGIISGICRGTPIGHTVQFYEDRDTFDNDPRGLGAVIQAGIEMELLMNQ
jgi:unsaturated rhamnogalacturonyl hydrolase